MNNLLREQTYLTPGESRIRFEAWVIDDKYLFNPNYGGEYRVSLQLANTDDYHRFMELGEWCLMELEMRRDPRGNKTPKNCYQTNKGFALASQLFAPIINISEDKSFLLHREIVSIAGHFRDGPDGSVYFQLDYLDVYEHTYPEVAPVSNQDIQEDDW